MKKETYLRTISVFLVALQLMACCASAAKLPETDKDIPAGAVYTLSKTTSARTTAFATQTGWKEILKKLCVRHVYVDGVCRICGSVLDDDHGFDASCAGTYRVKTSGGAPLRPGPYKARGTVRKAKNGETLIINGSVRNSYENLWYKTEDGLYIYSGNVIKVESPMPVPDPEPEQEPEPNPEMQKTFAVSLYEEDDGCCYILYRNSGEVYGNLGTPDKAGYQFVGWYTKPSGGEKINSSTDVVTGDIKLYAHYEKIAAPQNVPYTEWKKTDPRWADTPIGSSTIGKSGGLVVSLAIAMVDAGMAREQELTPDILAQKLAAAGGFTSNGSLVWEKVPLAMNGFKEAANVNMKSPALSAAQKLSMIKKEVDTGYKVIVQIVLPAGTRYVLVDRVDADKVFMFDPSGSSTDLFATYGAAPNYIISYDYPNRVDPSPERDVYMINPNIYLNQKDEWGCYTACGAMMCSNYRQSVGLPALSYWDVYRDNGGTPNYAWSISKYGLKCVDLFTSKNYAGISVERKVAIAKDAMRTYTDSYGILLGMCCNGSWHAVVITGWDGDTLYVNDPARTAGGGKNVPLANSWFSRTHGLTTQEQVLQYARSMSLFIPV